MFAESRIRDPESLPKAARTRLRLVRDEIEATGAFTADLAARRAGSATATFYNHFPSKELALEAVHLELMDELVASVEEMLRIERVLDVGLEAFVGEWVLGVASFFRRNARVFRAAQVALPDSKAMRDVFRDREARALEIYARFVRLGQAARVIRDGDAATTAARSPTAVRGSSSSPSAGWRSRGDWRTARSSPAGDTRRLDSRTSRSSSAVAARPS